MKLLGIVCPHAEALSIFSVPIDALIHYTCKETSFFSLTERAECVDFSKSCQDQFNE